MQWDYDSEDEAGSASLEIKTVDFDLDFSDFFVTITNEIFYEADTDDWRPSDTYRLVSKCETLLMILVNNEPATAQNYALRRDNNKIILNNLPKKGIIKIRTRTSIADLEGLPKCHFNNSNIIFRGCFDNLYFLTYFPEYVEELITFNVTIKASAKYYTALIAPGNKISSSLGADYIMTEVWQDPIPKELHDFCFMLTKHPSIHDNLFLESTNERIRFNYYSYTDQLEYGWITLEAIKSCCLWYNLTFKKPNYNTYSIVTVTMSQMIFKSNNLILLNPFLLIKNLQSATDQMLYNFRETIATILFEDLPKSQHENMHSSEMVNIYLKYAYQDDYVPQHSLNALQNTSLIDYLLHSLNQCSQQNILQLDNTLIDHIKCILDSEYINGSVMADQLMMPDITLFVAKLPHVNVQMLAHFYFAVAEFIATSFEEIFIALYEDLSKGYELGFTATDAANRKLKNVFLWYLSRIGNFKYFDLCHTQLISAKNITDKYMAAEIIFSNPRLPLLISYSKILGELNEHFGNDPFNKNLLPLLLATVKHVNTVKEISDLLVTGNMWPQIAYDVIKKFISQNFVLFHHHTGAGYKLLSKYICHIAPIDPAIAYKLCNLFIPSNKLDNFRQQLVVDEFTKFDEGNSLPDEITILYTYIKSELKKNLVTSIKDPTAFEFELSQFKNHRAKATRAQTVTPKYEIGENIIAIDRRITETIQIDREISGSGTARKALA